MIKTICDKCGKENVGNSTTTPFAGYSMNPDTNDTIMISVLRKDKGMQIINLCDDCTKAVMEFIFGEDKAND